MRFLKLALAAIVALAVVAFGGPAVGAGSSGGDQVAGAAKGKRCKGKKGTASAAKKKGCKKGKGKGKGPGGSDKPNPSPPPVDPTGTTVITLNNYFNTSPMGPGFESIHGQVTSNNNSCLSGRVITLVEELGAKDAARDTSTVTAGFVNFDFSAQLPGDDFYALATQDTVGSTACAGAVSNLISKP